MRQTPVRAVTAGAARQHTLERRLFGWLLTLLLVPTMIILGAALLVGSRSVELIGTLGPWTEVAASGRSLFDEAAAAARSDTSLANAIDVHQRNLSASLVQARRWSFLGERAAHALPWLVLFIALVLATISWWVSRRIARELARPIAELVGWAALMGGGLPLPEHSEQTGRRGDVSEVEALRVALRDASQKIAAAQARALEDERIRAWGEMARRVAHEMKNPLTPLRLAVHRLAGSGGDALNAEPLEVIKQETERLEDLARQFGVLGRPSAGTKSDVDVRELFAELVRSDIPAGIETRVEASGDPVIEGYYDALHRAFRNVIRNAVEAIETAPARDPAGSRIDVRIEGDGAGLQIAVADTGRGIPADRIGRIFEPDFTLKAGGTGLGLAVVRQAVAAHGGTISVMNTDRGARFDVWLPRVQAGAPRVAAGAPRATPTT